MTNKTLLRTQLQGRLRQALPETSRFKARTIIHHAGDTGGVWRVLHGAVVLTDRDSQGPRFAGLALPGDLLGAEALYQGSYAFTARPLTPCELTSWPLADVPIAHDVVARSLIAARQRTAELMALRSGSAQERVCRLILLLSASTPDHAVILPTLQDMSLMTDLAGESICREMTRLRVDRVLSAMGKRHHFVLARSALLARVPTSSAVLSGAFSH
ncbi:MAG TPA: cyclic nucleotide-binding domain-containing protein [Aquabacterium sp.]|uniref:Crp/Fnr family transcriptional regulator n=1 Tax=Aquabacterium sp. TaxID=1872578 RepID=UPI002E34AC4C|nr:cyclic nucleotide-binding domain-containing protein [Aquabacterium sp.]HEX5355590.1 cyclic nucleotide-binding domain-containing protein [Aquabacterium sp.]